MSPWKCTVVIWMSVLTLKVPRSIWVAVKKKKSVNYINFSSDIPAILNCSIQLHTNNVGTQNSDSKIFILIFANSIKIM